MDRDGCADLCRYVFPVGASVGLALLFSIVVNGFYLLRGLVRLVKKTMLDWIYRIAQYLFYKPALSDAEERDTDEYWNLVLDEHQPQAVEIPYRSLLALDMLWSVKPTMPHHFVERAAPIRPCCISNPTLPLQTIKTVRKTAHENAFAVVLDQLHQYCRHRHIPCLPSRILQTVSQTIQQKKPSSVHDIVEILRLQHNVHMTFAKTPIRYCSVNHPVMVVLAVTSSVFDPQPITDMSGPVLGYMVCVAIQRTETHTLFRNHQIRELVCLANRDIIQIHNSIVDTMEDGVSLESARF